MKSTFRMFRCEMPIEFELDTRPRRRVAWLATACLLLSNGCGKGDRLPTFPAGGTVKYEDGSPVEAGSILFISPEHKLAARSLIEDGSFTLGTYEETDGAVAGLHQVAVNPAPPVDFDPDAGRAPPTVKQKYLRPETSGLEYEVSPDGANVFDIVVERRR